VEAASSSLHSLHVLPSYFLSLHAAPILSVCVFFLQLNQKQILPPFRPPLESELDLDNFDPQFTLEPVQLTPDDT
jgi:hypothetical protein